MAEHTKTGKTQHIFLLGASGASGLAFVKEHLVLPDSANKPYLTLYVRRSGREKLCNILPLAMTSVNPTSKVRIIEGGLTEKDSIRKALSGDSSFPDVTVVISVLGAYMSLYHFLTRTKPTPIADAFKGTIVPAMQELGVKRILVLSTHAAFPVATEGKDMSWGWYFNSWLPTIVVPQGKAEMKGIAETVLANNKGNLQPAKGLEATVFRVPMLTNGDSELEITAFLLGGEGNTENKTLSRGSMSRWLLREIENPKWIGGAPMLCNI